ncbi:MAG TPA: hypothetical protein VF705_07650 [Longimicrobium sp.]|jgi:hypothetical protein
MLEAGSTAPAALAASRADRVRATWVFDARDLLRCRSSARELRHLHARFGGAVEITAIALDADRPAVESFLRYERVQASVRYLSTRDGSAPAGIRWPALYLARGARIEKVFFGIPLDDTISLRSRNVEETVGSLLVRSGTGDRHDTQTSARELR